MTTVQSAVDKLCQELNLGKLSEEQKNEVLATITEHISKVASDTILTNLSESDFELYKQAATSADPETAVAVFVAERPALAKMIALQVEAASEQMKAALTA